MMPQGAVNRRRLNVTVIAANGIKGADFGGKSDPFCTLIIKNRGMVKNTSTKMGTIAPMWNEEFEFEVVDEFNDVLEVALYDWDKSGNNDFLGLVDVAVSSVVNAPGPVTMWYPLVDRHSHKPVMGLLQLHLVWTDANGVKRGGGFVANNPQQAAMQQQQLMMAQQQQQAMMMQAQQLAAQQQAQQMAAAQQQAQMQAMVQAQRAQMMAQQQQAMAQQQAMMSPGMMSPGMMMPGMVAAPGVVTMPTPTTRDLGPMAPAMGMPITHAPQPQVAMPQMQPQPPTASRIQLAPLVNDVEGLLVDVSVGQHVWGVNAQHQIYRRDGNTWTNIPGMLKCISAADDGSVYGCNANDDIFKWENNTWALVQGKLREISCGSAQHVWGINAQGQIYRKDPAVIWANVPCPHQPHDISVGSDGTVYITAADHKIYRHENGNWINVPGLLVCISVANANNIVGCNAGGQVYQWVNAPVWWQHLGQLSAPAKRVSLGNHGLWVVGQDQRIRKL